MASVDTLIDNATVRANTYASATDILVAELRSFIRDSGVTVDLPEDIDVEKYTFPAYVPPDPDTTPTPEYEPTTIAIPAAPDLTAVGGINVPAARTEPTIDRTGLFEHPMPSLTMPEVDETPPNFAIDDLVAELNAVVLPEIQEFDFPDIHTSSISDVPDVTLPEYNAPALPDEVRDPDDYETKFIASYDTMSREMQAFVDDNVNTWVSTYAPEYSTWVTQLQSKISANLTGDTVLPDEVETAMFSRAQGRAQREYNADMAGILENAKRTGTMELPGSINSAILQTRFKRADALANQATDIYIERRKTEVQHAQFVMNLASSQISSVRSLAVNYAQVVGSNMRLALEYAQAGVNAAAKLYDHLLARVDLRLNILRIVDEQFKAKLQAALMQYDKIKVELEVERSRTDLDMAKIKQIESRITAQDQQIRKYTAIIDAVGRKASLEQLKAQEFDTRAKLLDLKVRSQLAGFSAYEAAMRGDQAKLTGELSKYDVFSKQVDMDRLNLDAQVKQIAAVQSANEVKVQMFKSQADMYNIGANAALQKFTAQAEVKKLAQSLFGQELTNAIEEFRAGLELPKIMINAILQQYQLRMQSAIETAKIELEKVRIAERASEMATNVYQSMASSAIGSLNTMVSSAISAAA